HAARLCCAGPGACQIPSLRLGAQHRHPGPRQGLQCPMIFIDRVDITKPDGSPATPGSNQLVYLAVPIKQSSGSNNGQMLIYGLTADPADAPGPHGVYVHANTHRMERSTSGSAGKPTLTEEQREFAAASGEPLGGRP